MDDIKQALDKIKGRISDPNFLANKGLANEVGIHFFCYDPADELIVNDYMGRLSIETSDSYNIIECDLYKIFLDILSEKRVLTPTPGIEEKKGKDFLLDQLQSIATPEAFLAKMRYSPHMFGDVLILTGVGKAFPFMRSHRILDIIQQEFSDIPIIMLYPGKFNGRNLSLFGKFLDGHYYRAFNLL